MKLALCVGMLLVAGRCVATKTDAPPPQESVDALLAVALHRALVDPRDLPDLNLIDGGREIVIRSSILDSTLRVGPGALPAVAGKKLLLLSDADVQARAAERGDVYYVAVNNLKVTGDEAELNIGVAMATAPVRPVLCCCSATVRYARVKGSWVYIGSTASICS